MTCTVGVMEGFEVKVGLHQGPALSPYLFAMVMGRMMDEIREEAPRTMMFADDSVICSESNLTLQCDGSDATKPMSFTAWRLAQTTFGSSGPTTIQHVNRYTILTFSP